MDHSIDIPEEPAVTIGRDGTYLLIYPPDGAVSTPPSYFCLPIAVRAPNIEARSVLDLSGWDGWVPGLTGYFDGLATDWRGWKGTREWHDEDGGVRLSAVHPTVGSVDLTVRLDPTYGAMTPGGWVLEIAVPVEPGQLESIAQSVRALFEGRI